MEPLQTHDATLPQQGLTQPAGGCSSGPRPEDLLQGGHECANTHVGTLEASGAVDCATAGTTLIPEVSANKRGVTATQHNIMASMESEPQKKVTKAEDSDLEAGDSDLEAEDISPGSNIPVPYTPEEAFALIIDLKWSVETYKLMRIDLNSRGCPTFPPFSQINSAKKVCYPTKDIKFSKEEISVSLQALLAHTLQRIVLSSEAAFIEHCSRKGAQEVTCVLEGSWEFYGSTGQSIYELGFFPITNTCSNENSLFATTFVPLRIVIDNNIIAWINPVPSTYRFCRPLHVQYREKCLLSELNVCEKSWVEKQIESLLPISVKTSKGHNLMFHCDLTMIDRNVVNNISETSLQFSDIHSCPFCELAETNFNDLEMCYSKPTIKENLQHGINPLHTWIRIFEFLLHLGYKNDPAVQKWRVDKGSMESQIVEERKKRIQAEIKQRMGLLVDVEKLDGGITNDGDSARTALCNKYRGMFGEILGLPLWLLDGFHVILRTICEQFPIDAKKFGAFCRSLAERYVQSFKWHPMTVTVHKILVHGEDIIESCSHHLGMLCEESSESRNRLWRPDREYHCREITTSLLALFQRALELSDPLISMAWYLKMRQESRIPLPSAVRELISVNVDKLPRAEKVVECLSGNDDDDDEDFRNDLTVVLSNENNLYH